MDRTGSSHPPTPRWERLVSRTKWQRLASVLVAVLLASASPSAFGQEDEEEPPPAPRDVELKTKDGVMLNAVYYEGTEGEKTVPVIVIHDWKEKEKAADYETFAEYLQSKGYAVMIPDLRGHGNSTRKKNRRGDQLLNPGNVDQRRVVFDLEAVRMFLLEENNAKKLNLSALCLVGVGNGAILATAYARLDWASPYSVPNELLPPAGSPAGSLKKFKTDRGGTKDIKAMVLVSPAKKLGKYMKIDALWQDRQIRGTDLSILILVGQKEAVEGKRAPEATKESKTAKNIYQRLKQYHNTEGAPKRWTLFLKTLPTEHNGETLVNETEFDLEAREDIAAFLKLRLQNRLSSFPWKQRELP